MCGISVKSAERELIQPGGTLCIHHLCIGQIFTVMVLWNKLSNAKYLNALQHSLSWFCISSLVGLAEQGCILGFGSGSGQLQFQAKRKICCSHERVMELQAVLWKFATPLSALVQDPKDHFYPLPKELTWLSPKSMKRDIIFPSAMNHGRGGEVWKIIHR